VHVRPIVLLHSKLLISNSVVFEGPVSPALSGVNTKSIGPIAVNAQFKEMRFGLPRMLLSLPGAVVANTKPMPVPPAPDPEIWLPGGVAGIVAACRVPAVPIAAIT